MTLTRANSPTTNLAYFISPHGFGHASRASAVMEALLRINGNLNYEIFANTPAWFFDSLPAETYNLHPLIADVGMVQNTPMREDIPATLQALADFTARLPGETSLLARTLQEKGCHLVLCDISPLGIIASRQAGIPSILIENFTWDWIYQAYTLEEPRFDPYITLFQEWFGQADLHIQTEPLCLRIPGLPMFPPASRLTHLLPREVKAHLGVAEDRKTALVSLGSLLRDYPIIEAAAGLPDWTFLIPDAASEIEEQGNLVLLPQHFEIGHPDLVNASDVLIAKSGYSTIAEAYASGTPYGYLNRPSFPESPGLENFLLREMPAFEIRLDDLRSGSWINRLDELAALPPKPHPGVYGADEIARFIYAQLD